MENRTTNPKQETRQMELDQTKEAPEKAPETMAEATATMGMWHGARLQRRNAAADQKKRLAKIQESQAKLAEQAKQLAIEIDQAEQPHAERMKKHGLALCEFFGRNPDLLPAGKAKRGLTGGVWGEFAGFKIGTGRLQVLPKVAEAIAQADQHRLDGETAEALEVLQPHFPKATAEHIEWLTLLIVWEPKVNAAYGKSMVEGDPNLVQPSIQIVKTAKFELDGEEIAKDLIIPALTAEA